MSGTALPSVQFFLSAADWTLTAAPYLVAIALATSAGWAWYARRRLQQARAALAYRSTVEVVPTSAFDPSEGEVVRFSHHLARVRYAADEIPARGAAVRLRYSAVEGQMRCFLEGPAQAAAILSMPGFANVDVRSTAPADGIAPVHFAIAPEGASQ